MSYPGQVLPTRASSTHRRHPRLRALAATAFALTRWEAVVIASEQSNHIPFLSVRAQLRCNKRNALERV